MYFSTDSFDFGAFRRACRLFDGVDKRENRLYRGFLISIDGQLQVLCTDGKRLAFSDPIPVKPDKPLSEPVFINLNDPTIFNGYLLQLSSVSAMSIDYDAEKELVLFMFDNYDPESFSTHPTDNGRILPATSFIKIRDGFKEQSKLAWQLEGVTGSIIWNHIKSSPSNIRTADRVYTLVITQNKNGARDIREAAAIVVDKGDMTLYTGKLSGLLHDSDGRAKTVLRCSHETLNLMHKALNALKEPLNYYHYIKINDADDVRHVWTCANCHYYAMPMCLPEYQGDETQEEHCTRTGNWYGVSKKQPSKIPTPKKSGADQTEPAETVQKIKTDKGYTVIGKGQAGPAVLATVEKHDISETTEPAADDQTEPETQEAELEASIELNADPIQIEEPETTEPETTEPETTESAAANPTEPAETTKPAAPDFSALVLFSDVPTYAARPYGTQKVKNRAVQFITVSGSIETDIEPPKPAETEPAAANQSTEPAAPKPAPIPRVMNLMRPELGDCLCKTADFELYKNDALKRYRLVFRKHLSREERAFLFVNKWTWRREYKCYQWGLTKNGTDAVKKTVEYFRTVK